MRQWRLDLGLTQKELANLLGSSQERVSFWERTGEVPAYKGLRLKLISLFLCSHILLTKSEVTPT
jgi:transcriptional regulator with XRE-family HTH domain